MDRIASELLVSIFHFIDSTRTLTTCREVSKLWITFAEEAILNLTIDISHAGRAWKFYDYLLMDISRGEMLKAIDFGYADIANVELKKRILRLVFIRNMNIVQGHHCCNESFEEIINITKNELNGQRNLKAIPHPTTNTSRYNELALMLKIPLRDIYLVNTLLVDANAIQDAINYLTQFQNSISFAVDLRDANMLNTLVNITVELPKIKEFTMYISVACNSANALINGLQDIDQKLIASSIEKLRVFTDLEACTELVLPHSTNLKPVELYFEDGIDQSLLDEMINTLKITPHYIFEFSINDRYLMLQDFLG